MQQPTAELPALSLIVLQSGNIEAAKDFYALLELSFVEERHGRGSRHYACVLGSVVFEIYPRQENNALAATRIGFRVTTLDRTIDALRNRGVKILREPADSPWGRRAIVEDPDGNCVELTSLN